MSTDADVRSHASAVLAFLSSLSASEFRAPGTLVQIPATASFADALQQLNDANITGAPVYDDVNNNVRRTRCC